MSIKFFTDDQLPEPERTKSSKGKYIPFFRELRERPGLWAQFPKEFDPKSYSAVYSTASQIRNGLISGSKPAGAFEAKIRNRSLYVRYASQED